MTRKTSAGECVSFPLTDEEAAELWAYVETCGKEPCGASVKELVFSLIREPFEDEDEENLATSGAKKIMEWALKNPDKIQNIKSAALRFVMNQFRK